ncbi:uncharacterized protein EV154DRAFT_516113 [Mucor mucedo]|uniref:uncharacterized protein n=1 Tax=Mucor mucedo TaxID=29922 RepID=UPI00221FBB7A|nr:uncharacterized protein EV154DRAFT_516113 [Mucor mucedo]KAI7888958.1 hypothetical protein EV154DRAFT_516113 [Mucor mucedo]
MEKSNSVLVLAPITCFFCGSNYHVSSDCVGGICYFRVYACAFLFLLILFLL